VLASSEELPLYAKNVRGDKEFFEMRNLYFILGHPAISLKIMHNLRMFLEKETKTPEN
jgi:hypothetical protein